MSWQDLLVIIGSEAGAEARQRVEDRARAELAGVRISVPGVRSRPRLTDAAVQAALRANGWNVEQAARQLRVNPSTIYRRLSKQQPRQPAPRIIR